MGFLSAMKANKAHRMQQNGQREEAAKLYEEAFAEGLKEPRFLLAYARMIIRDGKYQKAKEFLVANQKVPMTPGQRVELLVYYATCCFRLGNVDKGIDVLEQQFRKTETGLLYQTLGYLYVAKYDLNNRPDFTAQATETPAAEDAVQEAPAEEAGTEEAQAPVQSPEEAWNAGIEKAEQFIRNSVEYDDEDPVCLDNLGEFLYRVRGDKEAAKEWFDKAIGIKENQIDTLYFLSRYDLDAGNREAAIEKLEKAIGGRFSPLNYCSREMVQQEIEKLKGAL